MAVFTSFGMPSVTFGPFAFDPGSRLLKRDGVELPLPPRVTGVLEILLKRAGDVVPRQELMDSVWRDAFVTDTSLAEAVSVLRQTLGDDPQAPSYIQTLHRRGYRFVAPVAIPHEQGPVPAEVAEEAGADGPSISWQLLPWSVAAICAVMAGVALWQTLARRDPNPPPVTRFAVAPLAGTRFDTRAPALALSTDGSRIAWSGCDEVGCRLYLRPSDRLEAVPIPGTEDGAAPFFSPDGRSLGFFADGHVKKVAISGGAPLTLADAADPLGGVWTRAGQIIYAGATPGLRMVRDTGGDPVQLTTPQFASGEVRHAWPALHPSADLVFFTIAGGPDPEAAGRLALARLDTPRSWTPLLDGVVMARAVSDDVLVLSTDAELQAAAFDTRRGGVSGAPQTIATNAAAPRGAGQFATSPAGALVSLPPAADERPPFFWWTSAGAVDLPRTPALDAVALSPDGRQAAGIRREGARQDIWIADLERGTASRVTHGGMNAAPIWSPDGATLFFASSDGGLFAVQRRDALLQQPAQRVYAGAGHAMPASVSPDGTLLALTVRDPSAGSDIWGLPLELDGGAAKPLIRTSFDDVGAVFSPDGRFVAYQSNEAGRWDVYVQRRADRHRSTVSTDGGTHPFWSADARALFFRSRDRLMRASVSEDGARIGRPELVARFVDGIPIAADRQGRVLVQRRSRLPSAAAIVTLQWVREARQLLGPPSAAMPR